MTQDTRTPEEREAARKALLEEADRWIAARKTAPDVSADFETARDRLRQTLAALPEKVEVPYDRTPEGERAAQFARVVDPNFSGKIDVSRIRSAAAFDRVLKWDGSFPGPCATGGTGMGKTFVAWQALRRLYVKENRAFKWFPVRLLVTELERYEKHECTADFFRQCDYFRILFVDDIDKINWDFESHAQMLFSFLDWVYRAKKPCIVTTNRDRAWWKQKAGDALVRRLFDDGCVEVNFK
jgi:hypothetical protein